SSPLVINRRWTSRRRGACGMCKLKKVRCDGATPCVNCHRHNQECQYIFSKKRQPAAAGSGSTSSENGSDSRPQINETSNGIANLLAEAQTRAPLSPGLTMSPCGTSANNLTNGSQNDLHRSSSTSDDQDSTRTPADEHDDSATWSLEIGAEGVHAMLPTADIRNILDLNAFSWPLSSIDTDCQFDFDMPFTLEQTDISTGASSTSLVDSDTAFIFNRSTRAYESPGSSEEMMRPLTLNSMRNFKQEEIYRIFESLSRIQTRLSSASLNDDDCRNGYTAWYWNDAVLMDNCRNACFDQPLGISNFLTRSYFDKYMKEARGWSAGNSVLRSLIDSVMAFGFHAFLRNAKRPISPDEKRKADYYSLIALNSHANVLCSPNTLLKLQTTVSEQLDTTIHSDLLTSAVNCSRSLKLEKNDLIFSDHASTEDQDLARRCLWYLYSLDAPYSIRRGISPSLDRDWIDHSPPQACDETDWLPIQCLYASVISSAAKKLYSQSALRQSPIEREKMLGMAYKLLEDWRSRLPATLEEMERPDMQRILNNHHVRHIALSMFRQYHEAIFMIYFPWTGAQSSGSVSEDYRRRSIELCVSSAQAVLATANQVSSLDML
ncbi:hypothetical protein OIDMADRAFT_70428, partial [Oidiodendron maius Zn]